MSRKNELHNAIQRVFVDEGLTKRKLSGRQACIDLIDLCEQLDSSKPNNYYGYIHSGNIQECHVEHIRELYDSIWIKITLLNYKNPTLKSWIFLIYIKFSPYFLSINQSKTFLTIIPFSLDIGILSNVNIIFS